MNCKTLLCAVLFGVFVFGGADSGALQKKEETPKKAPDGEELSKLAKARLDAAEKAYKAWFKDGTEATFSELRYQLSVRLLNAELDIAERKEQRIAAFSGHLKRMKEWNDFWKEVSGAEQAAITVESCRREAEYWLAKERSNKN